MDILCWRWNADLKVEFEDLSRQMSELSRLPAGLRGSIGRQIALVQASAKEEAPVRRFGSGGGELRQSIMTQMETYSDRMVAICYTNKEYAPYVEFGTGPSGEAHHAGYPRHRRQQQRDRPVGGVGCGWRGHHRAGGAACH